MGVQKPTGRNRSRYCGETIDIDALQKTVLENAAQFGWSKEMYFANAGRELYVLHRSPKIARTKICISAGIHGDEPAGPTAIRDLLANDQWPTDAGIWLFPCLNPTGFRANTRENAEGIDLNWDYRNPVAPETAAHIKQLDRLPRFDLMLSLHEDWEARGFYLYELNPDQRPFPVEKIIETVARHCPIDLSETIDGRPAVSGIIRPDLDATLRTKWPESYYLILRKTRWSCVLEAPSDFELRVRVKALAAAVNRYIAAI